MNDINGSIIYDHIIQHHREQHGRGHHVSIMGVSYNPHSPPVPELVLYTYLHTYRNYVLNAECGKPNFSFKVKNQWKSSSLEMDSDFSRLTYVERRLPFFLSMCELMVLGIFYVQ